MVSPPWRGRLAVVGVGLEGVASLSQRGRRLLEAATTVVGTCRHLELAPPLCGECLEWDGRPDSLDALLADRDGSRTVLLASGDPNLFGIGSTLLERYGAPAVDVEPAVSSLLLALARSGVPAAGSALLSAHGRPLVAAARQAWLARRAAILTEPGQGPVEVAAALRAAGVEQDARLIVAERLGGPAERVREGTVGRVPPPPYDRLAVVVVERRAAPGPGIGASESDYEHDAGLVTKAEARAVALAALDLGAEDIVWDVGAGSGSVAIEAGRLASRGVVYAIEREPRRMASLRRNLARHGAWNVVALEGEASAVLPALPAPDAVFLGGGGSALSELAALALSRLGERSLPTPGRLAAALATLESVLELTGVLGSAGLAWRAVQLQVARGRELAGRLGWEAENPVHLVSVRVPRS